MTYDLHELDRRIASRKEKFIVTTVLFSLLFAAATVIAVLYSDTTVRFLAVAAAVAAFIFMLLVLKKYSPTVLFRKEIRGINVKEHEFVALGASRRPMSRYVGFYKSRGGHGGVHNIRGIVYIKTDDGSIEVADGLSKIHTDIYEEGDVILRPAGARFPIIVSRDASEQPCPLCGTVNSSEKLSCTSCGLGILK